MTDEIPPLEDSVIVVRWDMDLSRVIVDLGQVEPLSAVTMLRLAASAVYRECDDGLVAFDGHVILSEDDDEDESGEDDD